jgi:hypothetical protein
MKNLLTVATLLTLLSTTSFANTSGDDGPSSGNVVQNCIIEDYNNSIPSTVKNILGAKGYSFSDSQADSNLELDLEKDCNQGQGPFAACTISIVGSIKGQEVYTYSHWRESDSNPLQALYRVGINNLFKANVRKFDSCKTLLNNFIQE